MNIHKGYNWVGIDYGSKLAGTTAIVFLDDKENLHCLQSEKKKDADQWISEFLTKYKPSKVFLDAPLSLPAAFFGQGEDFFYRECDKETKAMSPMFLGGLTARAMRLKHNLSQFEFFESYPGFLIRTILDRKDQYKKKEKYDPDCLKDIFPKLKYNFLKPPVNWHQHDALACWYTGWRHYNHNAIVLGNDREGVIIV